MVANDPPCTARCLGSRILNVPGKPLCAEHAESLNDERAGWTTKLLWDSVKCLTLQVNDKLCLCECSYKEPCCVYTVLCQNKMNAADCKPTSFLFFFAYRVMAHGRARTKLQNKRNSRERDRQTDRQTNSRFGGQN